MWRWEGSALTPSPVKSTACWGRMGPVRPHSCVFWPRSCDPAVERQWSTDMTWIKNPAAVRRQLGFVSTNTSVYDRMTAYELVAYYGRLHDMGAEILRGGSMNSSTQLEMNDIRDTLCSKMSTGMRQKVSIARALVHDPPVIIFDEATVGLDVLVARALLDIVAQSA